MYVSIIIPTHNRAGLIKRSIKAVTAQAALINKAEIIVVNDGGRSPQLPSDTNGIAVHYLEQKNLGPAAARNAGARAASGDILVFIDDDCIPYDRWLSSLLAMYDKHPEAGGVAGTLTAGADASAIGYWEAQEFIPLFNKLNSIFNTFFTEEGRVWFHFGCNASYKREVFTKAGGFNEKLRLMEDTDLQWRLYESGVPVFYTPEAVVGHNGGRSLLVEIKRCYRCGKAYRDFCLLHPEYRMLTSSGESSSNGIVKNVLSSIRRAANYASSPIGKSHLVCVSMIHKLMYALGYFSHRPSRGTVLREKGMQEGEQG